MGWGNQILLWYAIFRNIFDAQFAPVNTCGEAKKIEKIEWDEMMIFMIGY